MIIERIERKNIGEQSSFPVYGNKILKETSYWEVKFLNILSNLRSRVLVGITSNRLNNYYTVTDYIVSLEGTKFNCSGIGKINGNQGDSIGILVNMKQLIMCVFHNGKYSNIYAKLKSNEKYYPVIHFLAPNIKVCVIFPQIFPRIPNEL